MRGATATTRTAQVRGRDATLDSVKAYLPRNYRAVEEGQDEVGRFILIEGEDHCGWTLDGYVIPRLASALLFAAEVGA